MEENLSTTLINASTENKKELSNLQSEHNKDFYSTNKTIYNKGKTITTFNNTKSHKIKEELENFGGSLASAGSKNNPRFSKKLSRNNLLSNRGKNRLGRYKTLTEDNIKVLKQFGNKTNFNINININKIEINKSSEDLKTAEDNQKANRTEYDLFI